MKGTGRTLTPIACSHRLTFDCTGPIRALRGPSNHRHQSHHSQSVWKGGRAMEDNAFCPTAACWCDDLLSMHTSYMCFKSQYCVFVRVSTVVTVCFTALMFSLTVSPRHHSASHLSAHEKKVVFLSRKNKKTNQNHLTSCVTHRWRTLILTWHHDAEHCWFCVCWFCWLEMHEQIDAVGHQIYYPTMKPVCCFVNRDPTLFCLPLTVDVRWDQSEQRTSAWEGPR